MKEINDNLIYQAMGWIKGIIVSEINGIKTQVSLDGHIFDLFLKPNFVDEVQVNQEYWFKVYPQYNFNTNSFIFFVLKISETPPEDLEVKIPNIFVFKGHYNLVRPGEGKKDLNCFAIFRNFYGENKKSKLNYINNNNLISLLPVEMDERVPFDRENPLGEHHLFYQVLVRFDPKTKLFHFLRDIVDPSVKRPRILTAKDTDYVLERKADIVMIKGRNPQILVKFEEKPVVPAEGKKIALEINSDEGIRVRVLVKRKTLNKLLEKMESYESWVGSMVGKIKQVLPNGVIELESAGIQVYEKKQKVKEEPKEEVKEAV